MEKKPASRLIGAVLLIPALLAWLLALVLPMVRLLTMSLQKISPLRKDKSEFVGIENYGAVFDDGLIGSFVSGASLAVLPLLLFFAVGPLLGWAASYAHGTTRRLVRALMMLPLAAFVPAAAAVAWTFRDFPLGGFPDPEMAGLYERLTVFACAIGLIGAVAVTVYAAVFRPVDRPRWLAALAVSGIAVIAAVAMGIQQFGIKLFLPNSRLTTPTPDFQIFDQAFGTMRFGAGAAIGSVEFLVLAVLGLLTAGIIAASGLRISVLARNAPSRPVQPAATAGLAIAALFLVGVAMAFLLPWMGGLSNTPARGPSPDFASTWIAPLLSTAFAVGLGVLGGFGIGAMRPLGRFSELILLPFAPWLFTGTGPFIVPAYQNAAQDGNIGTFWGLIPPLWMLVPALFLFTLLFRGQADRAHEGTFLRIYVRPAVPAVVITTAVLTLVQAQDSLWATVMSVAGESLTAPAAFASGIIGAGYRSRVDDIAYSAVTPLWLIPLVVVGAVAAQWFYADRVTITTRQGV